jgi:hypothetical protein
MTTQTTTAAAEQIPQTIAAGEHELGRELVRVVAEHMLVAADSIVEIHATCDRVTVHYRVRRASGDIAIRARVIDATTDKFVSDKTLDGGVA